MHVDAKYGTLTDYTTGEPIRPATAAEHAQSVSSGDTGAFDLDGQIVFVAGGPEPFALREPIEAVNISEDGEPLVAMVDFSAGENVIIEQQTDAGQAGIFGWEGNTIADYRSRGSSADTETIFRAKGHHEVHRYVTFNLARQDT